MTDSQYISQVNEELASLSTPDIQYTVHQLLPRTFDILFANPDVNGYYSFKISYRTIGHQPTIKATIRTVDNTKVDTQTFAGLESKVAAEAIYGMLQSIYTRATKDQQSVDSFLNSVIQTLEPMGYSIQCKAKCMICCTSKQKSISILIDEGGTFYADVKRPHSRTSDATRYTGNISDMPGSEIARKLSSL